ncbi:MAG: biotin carboxylase [Actinomycetia bacterium]|nr:biotin carboxylase [Actinomycetes bacterium]
MADEEVRPDLLELARRRDLLTDAARPEAVRRRHDAGRRTARENLDDLIDAGSWVEYGGFAIAGQRSRRDPEELQRATPADGLVAGLGRVAGQRCAALSYDYTVLAGTQGLTGHRKADRLFEVVERLRLPVVFFTEGGGGRPGDTDYPVVGGLDLMSFALWARLSGVVPRVGVASGLCFAGNAALFGMCDITIATEGSSIGMGGPAMIEGGGLGTVAPGDVGPSAVQVANGVVDVLVADDAAAVAAAKQALSYFGGPQEQWAAPDQRLLRDVVPLNRREAYDVRRVVELLADTGSLLELRPAFAPGMVTALARIEGHPLGVIANSSRHMAGAITSDGADKAARFLQLCDAFGLPVLSLCDTPGIMVGPDAEKTALVRHAARLFVAGANLRVPFVTVVLRKGYGLGAMAMAGGSFHVPLATVAWSMAEVGGMGLEGAVRLGFRKELAAIDDETERTAAYERLVAAAYQQGRALSAATYYEVDDVIDPAETRSWVRATLFGAPPTAGRQRRLVDTW